MSLKLLGCAIAALVGTQASAAVLFADNFGTDLSQWASNSSGQIVAAPGGGNALAFAANGSGGDLFGAPISAAGGNYRIKFEYMGTCASGQTCGGFLGFNNAAGETWLAGDGPYPSTSPLSNTGTWQTVTVNFSSASPFSLKIEDWGGASDGPSAGNAYFRNLSVNSVPEPATWGLMIVGFGLVGVASRRRTIAINA